MVNRDGFSLLQIHRSKVSLLLFKFLLDPDNKLVRYVMRGDVHEFHFWLDVCVDSHNTWVPDDAQSPWHPTSCIGYEKYLWIRARLGPFPPVGRSIFCVFLHSSRQGNIVPWQHLENNSKRVQLKEPRVPRHPSTHSKFPTCPWNWCDVKECKSNIFPIGKIMDSQISFL